MKDILQCAWKSLSRKRLRTLLTVSGIMVGVVMVVIVSAISTAGKRAVNAELDSMGMNGLSVSMESGALSMENLEVIRQLSGVETAMPLMIEYSSSILGGISDSTLICGIDSGARQVISLQLRHGRLITTGDVRSSARVCMLDETVAQAVYGRSNIVGKTIELTVGGSVEEFSIVGVTETGSSLLQNIVEFIPGMVYIPYTTLQDLTGRDNLNQIAVRVSEREDVERAETRIVQALERSSGQSGYRTDNLAVQKERLGSLMDIVTLILTAISGISLLVSGLGIMTIMLVSVTERTREIGIKKAIGASRRRILMEFLAEAMIISFLGGSCGILLGYAAVVTGMTLMGIPPVVDLNTIVFLMLFSMATGVLFGVYPAVKASRLRPVDALRME